MQARLEQQHPSAADGAGEIHPKTVVIAGHVGLAAVERRPPPGHQWNVRSYVVAVFVPGGCRMLRSEQRRECRGLGCGPGDDDGVIAVEARQIVRFGWCDCKWGGFGSGIL